MDQQTSTHLKLRPQAESIRTKRARRLPSIIAACILCVALAGLAGCGAAQDGQTEGGSTAQSEGQTVINPSPDKYTWYVKDYSGLNLGNVGDATAFGELRDSYGASDVKLTLIAVDGSYVDVSDAEALKGYVVIGQNLKPNTEIKLIFDVDKNGEEYDSLVSSSSIDTIVLLVKKVGAPDEAAFDIPLTEISACPGPEVRYTQDYVGRNLAGAGYISARGDLRDHYGNGNVKLVPVADDGSFIDVSDAEALKQYRVVSQNVAPNTEIIFTLDPEYPSIVDSQSIEEIELRVTKIEQ